MFTRAITRPPGRYFSLGLTQSNLGPPDLDTALQQHASYISALENCGLQVQVLPPLDAYPDATFVEDVALLTPACAIVLNPGAPTRKGEASRIASALEPNFEHIYRINEPGTVEGGDILMIGSQFYIGITERTNLNGAEQVIDILESHDLSGIPVVVKDLLHLKTDLSCLDEQTILTSGEHFNLRIFEDYRIVKVPSGETYAANSLNINGKVLIPAGFPKTRKLLEEQAYPVLEIELSEFRKMDGGLSCLSLRY